MAKIDITRLAHASLRVDDNVDTVRDFYTHFLGMGTIPRDLPEDIQALIPGHWLTHGDLQIHLIQAPPPQGPLNPTGPHHAFFVRDYAAARAALEAEGIAFMELEGQLFFEDPAGNVLELQQDPDLG